MGMREKTNELHTSLETVQTSLETAIAERCQTVADDAKLGREELWHVLSAVQERASYVGEECRELDARTEQSVLGQSEQLQQCASLAGVVSTKLETLEQCSLREQVALTARIDECTHDLARTTDTISNLADRASFIESRNAQFRLYLMADGDAAIFQRNDQGKWGSDFQGVPCWHSGTGERPLCCVNRDM